MWPAKGAYIYIYIEGERERGRSKRINADKVLRPFVSSDYKNCYSSQQPAASISSSWEGIGGYIFQPNDGITLRRTDKDVLGIGCYRASKFSYILFLFTQPTYK